MSYTILKEGLSYGHKSGGEYLCERVSVQREKRSEKLLECDATLVRTSDNYTLEAHGTRMTEEGKIHWDYSTGGHWK